MLFSKWRYGTRIFRTMRMKGKRMNTIKISIDIISLFEDRNNVHFTQKAIDDAMKNIVNKPIIITEPNIDYIYGDLCTLTQRTVGVITSASNGLLWGEIEPSVIVKEHDGNTITSFELNGIHLNL